MKTIVINGLKFTDQPPMKEGWWLWTRNESSLVIPVRGLSTENYYGGFWHELVPRQVFAEEVEKAYREGWCSGFDEAFQSESWDVSRAKRIAEGKE